MAKDKEKEALYKAEGQKRIRARKDKRRRNLVDKQERRRKLYEFDGRCCEYASYGQTSCDWSC